MERINFIIPFKIYYYTLEPIIKYFLKKNQKISIFLPENAFYLVSDLKKIYNLKIYSYERLVSKYKIRKIVHSLLLILLTPYNYSNNYKILQLRNFKTPNFNLIYNFFFRIVYLLSFISPKSKNVNKKVHKIMSLIFTNDIFSCHKIIVGSLNPHPHLLLSKSYKVYSIMESWDHVVKQPSGYVSRMAFLWNKDLAKDWEKYNCDYEAYGVYPFKLRFSEKIRRKEKINSKICCYAVAYSDKFKRSKIAKVEHIIVKKIAIACQKSGWKLLIKLRPNGRPDEFNYLLKEFKNIEISSIESIDENPANYFLSKEYNLSRFKFLDKVSFVINCFTTFGLDCVFANIPVLQLDVRRDNLLKDSKIFYENHHIKKYLLDNKNILKVKSKNNLEYTLEKYLNQKTDIHTEYSKSLLCWIEKGEASSLEEACKFIYEKVIND